MDGEIRHTLDAKGSWIVELFNSIDETVTFPQLPKGAAKVLVKLGKVTYINSSGVRNWAHWLRQLSLVNVHISEMPLSFIRAAETVMEVLPDRVNVDDFYLNYFCDNCNLEKADLVINNDKIALSQKKCPDCGEPMILELPDESYRNIMKHRP